MTILLGSADIIKLPMPLSKWIDIPPAWLLGAICLLWLQTSLLGGFDTGPLGLWVGRVFIFAGLGLMVAALWSFQAAKTSPIPHTQPDAIITSGVFGLSRNPIYLGDLLVLLGLGLGWGAILTVLVAPAFAVLITRRFILAEEKRLEHRFPDQFTAYKTRVRRWI